MEFRTRSTRLELLRGGEMGLNARVLEVNSGEGGLDEMDDGSRCGGSLIARLSIRISSVCTAMDRCFTSRLADTWHAACFVRGGRTGGPGLDGADVGGWMAMEGMAMGEGGGVDGRGGGGGSRSGFGIAGGSVWVAVDVIPAVGGAGGVGEESFEAGGAVGDSSRVWQEEETIVGVGMPKSGSSAGPRMEDRLAHTRLRPWFAS